ncbi:maleylpyruvate isomerase family mycothiol-dependent enzyme [Streptosporangium sp. NPDC051023]|uniref:maleylpyruvate isomerase family mycothiol-dependent enzyme n=1 Tax=Streptosporangium sp. NPDC051023 TaxID=3155410 RepID=UPI00344E521B
MNKVTSASGTALAPRQTFLSHDRYCAEIVTQADLLRSAVAGADLTAPVPSCPDWNLGQLLRHIGYGHRWAEEIVRTRAAGPPSDEPLRDLSGHTDEDPAELDPWLAEGAAQLADTLRTAGPGAEVWVPLPGEGTTFWARRFAHETAIHRADAALAAGVEFTLEKEVALDTLNEWMELGSLPQMFEFHPERRELLGPGRTIHLHATDVEPGAGAEWLVDLTGDVIVCRRAHEKAAVAVRGPLTSLLLVVYRRRPARGEGIDVTGDAQLLDFWLERSAFG